MKLQLKPMNKLRRKGITKISTTYIMANKHKIYKYQLNNEAK